MCLDLSDYYNSFFAQISALCLCLFILKNVCATAIAKSDTSISVYLYKTYVEIFGIIGNFNFFKPDSALLKDEFI